VDRNVKVGEAKQVGRIIKTAGVPGLGLTYLPSPPSELNPRVGSAYFRIDRAGPLWTSIQDSKMFGAFVPPELQQETEFELLVLLDS
jgi:predicted component of type VI protein secretion system